MKRRSLTLVVCLLATLSLASVGFAAWVISAGDVEYAKGNINVETVNDERVFIDDESIKLNGAASANFIFGKPVGATDAAGTWLESATVEEQVLEVVVTFTVTNKMQGKETVTTDNTALSATLSAFKMSGEDEVVFDLTAAITAGYIQAVPTATVVATGNTNEFKAVFTFAWGSLFENKNPFNFYNDGHKATDKLTVDANGIPAATGTEMTYGDHAAKYLLDMDTFFTGVQFKITLTAEQNNA